MSRECIEIDDVCLWRKDDSFENSYYVANCGFEFQFDDDRNRASEYEFNFCPKCGKAIMEWHDEINNI